MLLYSVNTGHWINKVQLTLAEASGTNYSSLTRNLTETHDDTAKIYFATFVVLMEKVKCNLMWRDNHQNASRITERLTVSPRP